VLDDESMGMEPSTEEVETNTLCRENVSTSIGAFIATVGSEANITS